MKKKTEKRTGKKLWLWVVAAIVVLTAVAVVVLWQRGEDQPEPMAFDIPGYTAIDADLTGALNDTLHLVSVGSYTGAYMEDGTDEPVENVLALIVENRGNAMVEYAALELSCGGERVEFQISALPAGAAVFVLAKDRVTLGKSPAALPSVSRFAIAKDAVLDFSEDFTLYPDTGVINIENVSGHDIDGDVCVYYKTWQYGLYLGGIAYRARVEGGMAAGAIAQSVQSHYNSDTSTILFMTYAQ